MNNKVGHAKRAACNESTRESTFSVWSGHKIEPLPLASVHLMSRDHLKVSTRKVHPPLSGSSFGNVKWTECAFAAEQVVATPPTTRKGSRTSWQVWAGSQASSPPYNFTETIRYITVPSFPSAILP